MTYFKTTPPRDILRPSGFAPGSVKVFALLFKMTPGGKLITIQFFILIIAISQSHLSKLTGICFSFYSIISLLRFCPKRFLPKGALLCACFC